MRELAAFAFGGFVGLCVAGVCLLPALVGLREERDELRGAIEEWAEADAAIPETARHDQAIPFEAFRRHAAAERTLHALLDEPEEAADA